MKYSVKSYTKIKRTRSINLWNKKKYTVETNRKLILSGVDKSKIYDQHILPLEPIDYNHIIHINILKTVNAFKMLLNEYNNITYSLEKHYIVFISFYNIWWKTLKIWL